ncbi:hypothetical protein LOC67_23470 [Stieleria sp. JC731]|uniref:hypothetical protein n=1 Tax=Pirellulaceae TaxID=2691357 RepID=UPI001E43F9E1|nr:hypothetical protein [Stieleria sp. JC731]MCC9603520.1 hypothetical protein [Stieleria sp. JC731]
MDVESRLAELEDRFEQHQRDIVEQIQGSMDATTPGIASRIQSLEGELRRYDLQSMRDASILSDDNRIKDGQSRMAIIESKVQGINKILWMLGSLILSAIFGALLREVVK